MEFVDSHDGRVTSPAPKTDIEVAGTSRDSGINSTNLLDTSDYKPASSGISVSGGDFNKITVGTSSGSSIFLGGNHIHDSPSEVPVQRAASNGPIETGLLQEGLEQFYTHEEDWYTPIEGLEIRPHILEDYYVELQQFEGIHRNSFRPRRTVPIEEVFLSRENKHRSPTRILVMGEAGYGKSTLCKKLVHDWIKRSKYISKFEIVILVRLRDVTSTIEEAVAKFHNKVMGSSNQQVQVLRYLKQLGRKFLLILDGYDELKENAKRSLQSILQYADSDGESYLKLATMLLTSRPQGNVQQEGNLSPKPLVGVKIRSDVCQSFENFFHIGELTDETRISFVRKYFKADMRKADSLIEIIRKAEIKLTRSPLLLHIMCYIHDQGTEINAHEDFWEQYLELIFKRAKSREEKCSLNLTEQGIHSIILTLGEIFLEHLKSNELHIDEQEIQDRFLESAPFVMSCGLLQKVFSFESEDPKKFETPHKTLMEYLAEKYLINALNQAEKEGNEMKFMSELLNKNKVTELRCMISTSYLSVNVTFDFFYVQFAISAMGTTCEPLLRVNGGHDIFIHSGESCIYRLNLWYLESGKRTTEFVSYLSKIDPVWEGKPNFKKRVELLLDNAAVLLGEMTVINYFVSKDCIDEFCNVMKVSDSEIADVTCIHSPITFDRIYEQTECNVEQVCSVILSKPGVEVHCKVNHPLRKTQMTELLLKKYGDRSNLELIYPWNTIHEKFLKKKGNKRKLKKVEFLRTKDLFIIRALKPGQECPRRLDICI